ncbi:MAG: PDZ domain-containing protein [Clostridiales bacterium]|nr:PDZ domain-containing protein [Clostridiales bacterium]
MNKKISLGVTMSLLAITAAITFILTSRFSLQTYNEKVKDVVAMKDRYERLDELDTWVRQNFYLDIDETQLMDSILKGYVEGLDDDYARYLNADEYKDALANESGTLVGIGISVERDKSGYIKIVEIMEESPAKESELDIDDIIVSVNGNDILTLGYSESIDLIRKGKEGTSLKLTIRKNGADKEYEFVRKSINLVTASGRMLDNNIGYIEITNFNSTTSMQFKDALDKLLDDGAKGIVFDVRNNPGGLVDITLQCLDILLPYGDYASATYGNGDTKIIDYPRMDKSDDDRKLDIPAVVLVNGKTASAGELFAAVLRDFSSTKLVGVKTFGKGIMQSTTALDGGGAITVTVATYQTTKSDCYHGIGLSPDYEIALPSDTGINVQPGASEEDTQLQKALELLLIK